VIVGLSVQVKLISAWLGLTAESAEELQRGKKKIKIELRRNDI